MHTKPYWQIGEEPQGNIDAEILVRYMTPGLESFNDPVLSELFSYPLPAERIASRPLSERAQAKLLVATVAPDAGLKTEDRVFAELPELLAPGDVLVLNNTRVKPTRFFVELNGREVEIFLLRSLSGQAEPADDKKAVYACLARPMRRLKPGLEFSLGPDVRALVQGRAAGGRELLLELSLESEQGSLSASLEQLAVMPIPTYIRGGRADELDRSEYQTVYAQDAGSVAAPTAGLHFTESLLQELREKGVETQFVTLHLGPSSFLPVESVAAHELSSETCVISAESWESIAKARAEGRRVVAVGTTSCRALESAALLAERFIPGKEFATSLFIKPGHEFKVVDLLITNFHQPESTHLLLVAAFMSARSILEIYQHALAGDYRFLSYGDAMLLCPAEKSD